MTEYRHDFGHSSERKKARVTSQTLGANDPANYPPNQSALSLWTPDNSRLRMVFRIKI